MGKLPPVKARDGASKARGSLPLLPSWARDLLSPPCLPCEHLREAWPAVMGEQHDAGIPGATQHGTADILRHLPSSCLSLPLSEPPGTGTSAQPLLRRGWGRKGACWKPHTPPSVAHTPPFTLEIKALPAQRGWAPHRFLLAQQRQKFQVGFI